MSHPHGCNHLGVAAACISEIGACKGRLACGLQAAAREELIEQRDANQDDGPAERGNAQSSVEGENDNQIDRDPGKVEQRYGSSARKKRTHAFKVADGLHAIALVASQQRNSNERGEDPPPQGVVERRAQAHENPATDEVEQSLYRE